jgi:hypothetical protein
MKNCNTRGRSVSRHQAVVTLLQIALRSSARCFLGGLRKDTSIEILRFALIPFRYEDLGEGFNRNLTNILSRPRNPVYY